MADAPPRGKIGAFSGGPFGIGWAPWAIGVGALALGIFFFMRRGTPATAQQAQGATGGALPMGQPYPYPSGSAPSSGSNPSAQQLQMVVGDIGGGRILSAPDPASNPLGFFSTPLRLLGGPIKGQPYGGSTSPGLVGVSSDQWFPVSYAGGTGYIWAPEAVLGQSSNPSAQQMANFAA